MRSPEASLDLARAVARSLGPRGLMRRGPYEIARRTGRVPTAPRTTAPLRAIDPSWRLPADTILDHWAARPTLDRQRAEAAAAEVRAGTIHVFGRARSLGYPPTWRPAGDLRPWTEYTDAGGQDVKDTWEPSRFGLLGPLLRAGAAHGSLDATRFELMSLVEDWLVSNPPYLGENWMCGQESSLRALSILFALGVTGGVDALDRNEGALIERLVDLTWERVAPTLGYALSQRNNHAISEASFLWIAGLLTGRSQRSTQRAGRSLRKAIVDQFAADGSYSQYSFTYQRLALHTLLLLDAVSRSLGVDAPADLDRVFTNSLRIFATVIEPTNGIVPNAGGNDGALLFDLTDRPIEDFRPLVAHLAARLGLARPFGPGSWDEEAAWFGHDTPGSTQSRLGPCVTDSYHSIRGPRTLVVARAGRRRHRPAHADMLHCDITVDGRRVAFDPGTFRYTAGAPWGNALADEAAHNAPTIPATSQARRIGRFLWAEWHDAELTETSVSPEMLVLRLTLGRRVELRRTIRMVDGVVIVTDECATDDPTVRWTLPDGCSLEDGSAIRHEQFSARFVGHDARVLERRLDDPYSGWWSPTYSELLPATRIEVRGFGGKASAAFGPPNADLDAALGGAGVGTITALGTRANSN